MKECKLKDILILIKILFPEEKKKNKYPTMMMKAMEAIFKKLNSNTRNHNIKKESKDSNVK